MQSQPAPKPLFALTSEATDPVADPNWDAWAGQFSEASCFHSSAWFRTLGDTYKHRAVGFLRRQGTAVTGFAPFVEVASPLTGRRGVCSAFADYCSPLARNQTDFDSLREQAINHAQHRGWRTIEFRGGSEWLGDTLVATDYFVHELDLSSDEDELLRRFSSAVRRNVRKAEREGVWVEVLTSAEAMKTYYALHCATRRRLGSPPQPFRFFAGIARHFISRGSGFVALARHKHFPIAGIVVLWFGKNAIYKFSASDAAHLHLRGNNLVIWKAIQHCTSKGLKRFHFGRTSVFDDGLRRFKSGWGALERQLQYFRYDLKLGAFVTAQDRANAWYHRIVCRMPRPMVRWLGGCIYPHLS